MEQKKYTCTQPTLVIENPSPRMVAFLNKLRDRQQAIFKEIQDNHDVYFPKQDTLFSKYEKR